MAKFLTRRPNKLKIKQPNLTIRPKKTKNEFNIYPVYWCEIQLISTQYIKKSEQKKNCNIYPVHRREIKLINQVGIIVIQYSPVWSNLAVRFGRLVKNIGLSSFYLFGHSDLAVWVSPDKYDYCQSYLSHFSHILVILVIS